MLGIIGGSGLEHAMGALGHVRSHDLDTPFGKPSGPIVTTEVDGVPVALLKRHGEGHVFSPSTVPYRANVFAMKKLGVTRILGTGAVGSLREEIAPRSLVIPDQIIDKTTNRPGTFFDHAAVHAEFAEPFCPVLRSLLLEAGKSLAAGENSVTTHNRGCYVCMEGPAFSTRAESFSYLGLGASVIGMTNLTEAKLAREAEICYGIIALSTDYDCWHEHHDDVTVEAIIQIIHQNVAMAKDIIRLAVAELSADRACACASAMQYAIITDKAAIPADTRQKLEPIVGKYL